MFGLATSHRDSQLKTNDPDTTRQQPSQAGFLMSQAETRSMNTNPILRDIETTLEYGGPEMTWDVPDNAVITPGPGENPWLTPPPPP
jgi:hypothetical protein